MIPHRVTSLPKHSEYIAGRVQKKRQQLQQLINKQETINKNIFKSSIKSILKHFLTTFIVVMAVLYAWFYYYPEPPFSPMLYQWKETGKIYSYRGYNIFYFDKTNINATFNQSSQTLLYLHGFPTSSFDIFQIVGKLFLKFDRIIAPDFIGFGFSDKPQSYSYSIKDQAILIQNLIKHLQLDKVHLLSHDYGDSVAQELLSLNKVNKLNFKISSVCMLNGGIFPSHYQPILIQRLLRMNIIGSILTTFSNYFLFAKSFSEVFGPYTKPTSSELHDFWKLIRINDGYKIFGNILNYIDERHKNENTWIEAIRNTPIPLHFIYGPADPINPPPFDVIYKKIIQQPSIDVLDKNIGHYPQLESPEKFIELYFNFLNSILK